MSVLVPFRGKPPHTIEFQFPKGRGGRADTHVPGPDPYSRRQPAADPFRRTDEPAGQGLSSLGGKKIRNPELTSSSITAWVLQKVLCVPLCETMARSAEPLLEPCPPSLSAVPEAVWSSQQVGAAGWYWLLSCLGCKGALRHVTPP